MIIFRFECDAPDCKNWHQFTLAQLCRSRHRHSTFFDTALYVNRDTGWRVEGNECELPNWDCKVFCRDHVHLHRDAVKAVRRAQVCG